MAKQDIIRGLSVTGQVLTVKKNVTKHRSKVKFGNVTVTGEKPSAAAVKINVERSTEALERIIPRLSRPGITIRPRKDVPQFSVAEGEPGVFIRRLNGRIQRGRLVDGSFQVID
jgi:translation initiation factor 2 gamma subunit (eIF-2gamma)